MNASDILWFKLQFGPQMARAVAGTPFDVDMLTAIACQETGYIWSVLRRKGLAAGDILALCVGDTLDEDRGRRAFPRTRAQLLAHPQGDRMFDIARQALVELARHVPAYAGAARRPHKFCHGFGVFQYDLQFFKTNPQHFLERRYADFDAAAALAVDELKRGLGKLGWSDRSQLGDLEMAHVAIAYNTGRFDARRGLKQGHKSDDGRYYGEAFYDFLLQARAVRLPDEPARPGETVTPPPSAVTAGGATWEVDTRAGLLNLRATPDRDPDDPTGNVRAGLPDGHRVRAVGGEPVRGFLEVETQLSGALLRGWVSLDFLKKAPAGPAEPSLTPPAGLVAVHMPRRPGTLTRRRDIAGAHSLNEPGMPARRGDTPARLCTEIAAIIAWLDVEDPAHRRYQPRAGMTFCNIYAHDFCHLAGAYLPRVWWTPGALLAIGQGRAVEPKYGATIEEIRANGLFRWLRDFGGTFGWRQTGTLSKLQQHADQGGIGLIVARRTHEGRPGHIVMVVPETDAAAARRNAAGEVTGPVQSQAGARNSRYSSAGGWWTGAQFAEHAFWIHA